MLHLSIHLLGNTRNTYTLNAAGLFHLAPSILPKQVHKNEALFYMANKNSISSSTLSSYYVVHI